MLYTVQPHQAQTVLGCQNDVHRATFSGLWAPSAVLETPFYELIKYKILGGRPKAIPLACGQKV
ncbi:MAG: hypothetical protein K0R67_4002 [Paenibacillus sp.]|jgi:hypothetical protein|nr:hypothetical protein [Paenibacillus sp.]